jgi:hypothetical protein
VIVFRHADSRFPFLWESAAQPPARWHGVGEGPVAYFAETPDAAWAEFLRHENIRDEADLAGIERALWAIDLPVVPTAVPALPDAVLVGDETTYVTCQAEARRLRVAGGLAAPSAAVMPTSASGFRTDGGLKPGPARHEAVFALFGPQPGLVGWVACSVGRPRFDLLDRVRYLA